jgi:hypothetical protein
MMIVCRPYQSGDMGDTHLYRGSTPGPPHHVGGLTTPSESGSTSGHPTGLIESVNDDFMQVIISRDKWGTRTCIRVVPQVDYIMLVV